jgi:HAD superfamily hydrolase (TIGR01549 family)
MIKAVAFDFGNTLYDTRNTHYHEVTENKKRLLSGYLSGRYGFLPEKMERFFKLLEEELKTRKSANKRQALVERNALFCISEALRRIDAEVYVDELIPIINEYFSHDIKDIKALEGAVDLIKKLKADNFPIALVTNNPWHRIITMVLERDDLSHHFDLIISSSEIGYRKPSPVIFRQLLDMWSAFRGEEILFAGDAYSYDITGAREAGFKTAWYNPGRIRAEGSIHDYEFHSLPELADLIRQDRYLYPY